MAPKRDDNTSEVRSWLEYRLKVIDTMAELKDEVVRLHDIVLALEIRDRARNASWGWVGGVIGSIVGSLVTALVLKHLHP